VVIGSVSGADPNYAGRDRCVWWLRNKKDYVVWEFSTM
jgi:hypothetical protein